MMEQTVKSRVVVCNILSSFDKYPYSFDVVEAAQRFEASFLRFKVVPETDVCLNDTIYVALKPLRTTFMLMDGF